MKRKDIQEEPKLQEVEVIDERRSPQIILRKTVALAVKKGDEARDQETFSVFNTNKELEN